MFERLRENYRNTKMIREAIENYPDGLCFSAGDGRVILTNRKMNSVVVALTGHTITNAEAMWKMVAEKAEDAGDKVPENAEATEGTAAEEKTDSESTNEAIKNPSSEYLSNPGEGQSEYLVKLSDDSVWQFRRTKIRRGYSDFFQYEAIDVTELFEISKELSENNEKVKALQDRQREVLKTIVKNNVKDELLHAKMKIHGRMGELLIQTRNVLEENEDKNTDSCEGESLHLEEESLDTDEERISSADSLINEWEALISDLRNASLYVEDNESSELDELVRVADMIGCKISIFGEKPKEHEALHLLCLIIREALTNAVRHANANELFVHIDETKSGYHVRISDNGNVQPQKIHEGGGLSALRTKLESKGASLRYEYEDGLVLVATI